MSEQEQPENSPEKLPELRFKPGSKKAGSQADPKPAGQSSQSQSSALSIDDMLALTKGSSPSSQPEPAPQVAPSPPPAPQVQQPPPSPPPAPKPPTVAPPSAASVSVPPVVAQTPGAPPAPPPPSFPKQAPMALNKNFAPGPPAGFGGPPPGFGPSVLNELSSSKSSPLQGVLEKVKQIPKAVVISSLLTLVVLSFGLVWLLKEPVKLLIRSEPSGAEVFLAGESLGKTPLNVNLRNFSEMPELRLEGYENWTVPVPEDLESGESAQVDAVLKGVEFPLDWSGLGAETRVWWAGAEKRPKMSSAGKHKVKIKPKGQSSFVYPLVVSWDGGKPFAAGKAVAEEIKMRPVLKLSLSGASEAEVTVKDGSEFKHTVSLKGKSSVTLPGPGKYTVVAKGTGFKKSVDVKSGQSKDLKVALAVARPSYQPSNSGGYTRRPSYSPRPQYRPPPRYNGGGGGGGQIAPPAF